MMSKLEEVMGEAKTACPDKKGPIGEVETRVAELKSISKDVLEISKGIENFLLGQTPMVSSESPEKKEPCGWLQLCCDNLDETRLTLNLAMNCLRAIKNIN